MTERVLGPKDSPRRRRTLFLPLLVALVLGLALGVPAALGNHPEVSLPGSSFEIDTNANLKVDDAAPSIDWTSFVETRKADAASGSGDDSLGGGSKEDDPAPSVVDGSIPPNKSDLLNFGIYLETTGSGARFLNLFWHRVQEPSGTTNMDFEFNQLGTPSANGVTPVRSEGDLLIQYDLAQGGTNPILFKSVWVTQGATSQCEASNSLPCWGTKTNLTAAGDATGSINTTAIPSGEADGLGPISARTFGEAQLDFDALTGGISSCTSFGSAYLKSRSSDSFTSALKDFIAPVSTNLNNCGTVIIRKVTDPVSNPTDVVFPYTKSFTTAPATAGTFNLGHGQSQTYNNVLPGTGYTVAEGTLPTGWDFVSVDCSASTGVTPTSVVGKTVTFTIDSASDILDCTYTNRARGTIIVEKISEVAGAFDFTSSTLSPAAFTLTTTGAGAAGKDSDTFANLSPGTYDVAETVPAGWNLDSATCSDGSSPASIGLSAGETVTCTFTNVRERGAIVVTKTRKHAASGPGDHPHPGVDFTVNGQTKATDSNGQACFDGLLLGSYNVTESLPAGYSADGPLTKSVQVSVESTCANGAAVSFGNTPLTDVTVSVNSQVDGGTASTINCDGTEVDTGSNGDGSLTLEDLEPTDPDVITCTILIDP